MKPVERLIRLRKILGFSQRDLAEEFGVVHGTIGLWEAEKRSIPGPVIKLIELYEDALGVQDEKGQNKKIIKKIKTSWVSRSFKLSSTTAKIFTKLSSTAIQQLFVSKPYFNSIQQKAYISIAHQVVETMAELKGFALKVGQMFSYMDYGLPEPVREIFKSLLDQTSHVSYSSIVDMFLEDFKETPTQIFKEWNQVPFAAASIGQVYSAQLKTGEEVAVKVQYPNILKTFESDLKSFQMLDYLLSLIFRGTKKGELFSELKEILLDECDYLKEANYQMHFRKLYSDRESIVIPKVFTKYSTRHVLVTEYVKAKSFEEFCLSATQKEKNEAGRIIYKFAFESIFKHKLFNGDPHPGNYLFQNGKVVFLDFGCVKKYKDEFIHTWLNMIRAVFKNDNEEMDKALIGMGMVKDPKSFNFEHGRLMIKNLQAAWLSPKPFQFTSEYVHKTWKMTLSENPNRFEMVFPRDWLFTNRLQWGLFSVLASLNAEIDCRNIIEEVAEL